MTAETSGDAIRGVARTARIVSRVLDSVRGAVVHGTTSGELDSLVRSSLARFDAVPAMLGYADNLSASRADPPFPAALSVCVNDEIMGGSDPNRVLRAGDLVTADLAAGSRGWYADAAITWVIPGCQSDPDRVIRRASLAAASAAVTKAGVDAIEPGVLWSVVTAAMAAEAARRGVAVWAGYDGHGIGRSMHQPPRLPARPDDRPELQTRPLEPGMVITVEPVVSWEVGRQESVRSGWLDRTADGSDACFTEVTVAIGSRRARALGDGL